MSLEAWVTGIQLFGLDRSTMPVRLDPSKPWVEPDADEPYIEAMLTKAEYEALQEIRKRVCKGPSNE